MKLFNLFLLAAVSLEACTGLKVSVLDGSFVSGRTVEFGVPIEMVAAVIPRGYAFVGKAPDGQGLQYTAKYAVLGVYCFEDPVLMDGMNEKGLSAGAFYFPGFAEYTSVTDENRDRALSPIEFPNWILTQFATIEEVKNGLSSVIIAPTVSEKWGPVPAPFHYVVYDKQGRSLVIEPIGGSLKVYDNSLGVITNSPTFDWHMTNLRNFLHISPYNAQTVRLGSVTLAPFGQGSGLLGLPGDFTPPSRFVRAVFISQTAVAVSTSREAVFQAFHLLNQFDIPIGMVRQKTALGFASDYTMMTCVRDPKELKFYYKSHDDQTIKVLDLKQFDLEAKTIKKAPITGGQTVIDNSKLLR